MALLSPHQALHRLCYVGLVLLTLAISTTPELSASGLIMWPDLVYCITAAWLVRCPEHVPPWLLTTLFLLRDIILGLPPGLWTALVVLIGIALCLLHNWLKSQPYLLEWIVVSALFFCALFAMQCILLIAQLPISTLANLFRAMAMTALAYPLVSLFLHLVIRVRVSYEDTHEGAPGWL